MEKDRECVGLGDAWGVRASGLPVVQRHKGEKDGESKVEGEMK